MTIDELKSKVENGVQSYYHKEQVIELLDRLNAPKSNKSNQRSQPNLTLF
jgi:hypothetical protein